MVCDKDVCERWGLTKMCVTDVCVCDRWCVTKMGVKDGKEMCVKDGG